LIEMTLAEIAAAVGGELRGGDAALTVSGPVEFDSRKVGRGGLFVAFAGEKVDGHDFASAAFAAGAVAVLGQRQVGGPTVVVADPLDAMGRLARAVIDHLPELSVVGITGSSGKTSTKDMIAQVLARLGPTVAPAGSFNNELGLPHTVLKAGPDTRFLVLEMGARGIGHLSYLCQIAPPTVGVVVNVGVAHIGEFGSMEAIARAKGELVEALPAGGIAVLNADDDMVRAMADRTRRGASGREAADAAAVRAEGVELDEQGDRATHWSPGGRAEVRLGVTVAGIRSAIRCSPPRWPMRTACPWWSSPDLWEIFGASRPKDGCLRPCRRCHGHRRLV
jgi:UDP-N-acetylmuramoyl-tripeptide--D-alanyl-D-alanine ligase